MSFTGQSNVCYWNSAMCAVGKVIGKECLAIEVYSIDVLINVCSIFSLHGMHLLPGYCSQGGQQEGSGAEVEDAVAGCDASRLAAHATAIHHTSAMHPFPPSPEAYAGMAVATLAAALQAPATEEVYMHTF
jgi:hypothetical protein